MTSKFLGALFFVTVISLAAKADRTLISKGPYFITESRLMAIYKINRLGLIQVSRHNSFTSKDALQKIESELASESVDRGSFHTANNAAIVDWVSMKDGFTYGTMFGPPGEELFVIETSKFKNKKNQIDYPSFKNLCDKLFLVPAGG